MFFFFFCNTRQKKSGIGFPISVVSKRNYIAYDSTGDICLFVVPRKRGWKVLESREGVNTHTTAVISACYHRMVCLSVVVHGSQFTDMAKYGVGTNEFTFLNL